MTEDWERLEVYIVDLAGLREVIKAFQSSRQDIIRVSDVYLSGENEEIQKGFYRTKESGQLFVAVNTAPLGGEANIENLSVPEGEPIVVYTGVKQLTPSDAIKFLRDQNLVYDSVDKINALPALRRVWKLVDGLDVDVVRPTLSLEAEKRDAELEDDISILGMKIKSTVVIQAGPVLLASVLLYLLAHILHLKEVAPGNERLLRESPWMGVYNNRLTMFLMYSSTSALPIISTLWLVACSNTPTFNKMLYAFVYSATFSALSYFLTKHTRELNHLSLIQVPPNN